jgi:hypothetical protein
MIKSAEQCPSCAIIVDAIRLNQDDDVYPKQSITFEELKYQAASYHPGDRRVFLDVLEDNDLPGSLNNPKSHIYGLSITITREMDASPMGYLGIYAGKQGSLCSAMFVVLRRSRGCPCRILGCYRKISIPGYRLERGIVTCPQMDACVHRNPPALQGHSGWRCP